MSKEKAVKSTITTGYIMFALGAAFFVATQFITALFPVLFGAFLFGMNKLANNPNRETQAITLAAACSFAAVMLCITSAVLGTWTTFTSLVEQIAMAIIAAAHLRICVGYLANQANVDSSTHKHQKQSTDCILAVRLLNRFQRRVSTWLLVGTETHRQGFVNTNTL